MMALGFGSGSGSVSVCGSGSGYWRELQLKLYLWIIYGNADKMLGQVGQLLSHCESLDQPIVMIIIISYAQFVIDVWLLIDSPQWIASDPHCIDQYNLNSMHCPLAESASNSLKINWNYLNSYSFWAYYRNPTRTCNIQAHVRQRQQWRRRRRRWRWRRLTLTPLPMSTPVDVEDCDCDCDYVMF